MNRLRIELLSKIVSQSEGVFQNKYSGAYNVISSIVYLEKKEKESNQRLGEEIFKKFDEIENLSNNLNKDLKDVPLLIVEQYFLRNVATFEKFLVINYDERDIVDLKVYDLYLLLENFYKKIYMLAVEISDYYTFEFKLKETKQNANNSSYL